MKHFIQKITSLLKKKPKNNRVYYDIDPDKVNIHMDYIDCSKIEAKNYGNRQ